MSDQSGRRTCDRTDPNDFCSGTLAAFESPARSALVAVGLFVVGVVF
jgi:hypothetical protein